MEVPACVRRIFVPNGILDPGSQGDWECPSLMIHSVDESPLFGEEVTSC
jgi:hypothetical protein